MPIPAATYTPPRTYSAREKNSMALTLIHHLQKVKNDRGYGTPWSALPAHYQAVLSQVPIGEVDAAPGSWLFMLGNQGVITGVPGTAYQSDLGFNGYWSDFSYWGEFGEVQL